MTPKISEEQRQAIAAHKGQPVYVVDTELHTNYVLLPAEAWQKIRGLLGDDEFSAVDASKVQSAVAGNSGWDDPEMNVYDDYDAHKPPQS